MKWKNLTLEIAVVLACYLVITIPVTSATSVNIIFNGQIRESVEYDPSNTVNQHITYVRDPRDINWANVRVAITLNSASLAHTIKRVYLYKCGALSPTGCMQKTPEVFDNYVDTEIAWGDIGQSTGTAKYPQEGNILFLVKLEDPDGLTSWVGLWNTIRRTSHREFLFFRHELSDVDIYASSSRLVGPIASYIQNFNVIPFRWLTKAAFDDALSISAIGGDDSDLDTSPPILQSVEPATNEITVINKENYFVFPQTPGGIAFPITLEQNPDFQCGDGQCESSLGEDQETCCYDCSCPSGYYCDTPPGSPELGMCKDESLIDFVVVGTPSAEVSDCSHSFEVGITARINNVPASISDVVNGVVKVVDTPYAAQCTPSGTGLYDCRFSISPTIQCGSGTRQIGPNEFKLTINYNDGINKVTRDLTESFPNININYDCSCPDGQYCDTGLESCQREDGITLGIIELTSAGYLASYTPGDTINLKAKIYNPPTGTVLMDTSANLTLTGGDVFPGTPDCTGPIIESDGYVYDCRIHFSISPYLKERNYIFQPNNLIFRITYNDGPSAKTRTLTTEFGPISIPSQECGNDVCDVDENYENCCQDCGCEAAGDYCDVVRGCSGLDDITLSAVAYPRDLEDCTIPHDVNIQATIENAPYGVRLDYYTVNVNDQPVPWRFECPESTVGGVFNCMLEIPPIEGCELPHYTMGPNKLTFTISFPNGKDEQTPITRELSASFDEIYITPIPHIDGICEGGLGENGLTACLDCPCSEDPAFGPGYYCDSGPSTPKGTCLPKSDVALVVESPTAPVWFESCEELNKVYVLMHVRNQPSDMRSENVFATVGGEAARYVHCRESTGIYLDSNITFNCTIGIPPILTCTQGQTYNYTNNSISLVISYDNGERGRVLQSLTYDLPDVYIHQSIRSIWDIMEHAKNDMRLVLNRIMDLTEQMADRIHQCIKMQILVMFFNLVLTIALGYAGYKSDNGGWKGFGEGVQAAGTIGTAFSTMVKSICDMYQKYIDILIDLQELQLKKITMETCLAIAQHDLDTGRCRGNEQECFNNMISCLSTLSDMRSIRDRVGSTADSMGGDFINFNRGIQDIGEAISEGPWSEDEVSRRQLFAISIDGKGLNDNDRVCKNKGFEIRYGRQTCVKTGDNKGDAYIYVRLSKSDCSREQAVLTVNKKTVLVLRVGDNGVDSKSKIENFLNKLDKVDDYNDIELYCTNENPFDSQDISNDISKYKQRGRALHIGKGIPDDTNCQCTFKGTPIRWIEAIPSGEGEISSYTSKCSFEPGKEFILFRESALGTFIDIGSGKNFEPYNRYENGGCRVKGTHDLGKDVIIETFQGYEPYTLSGKEYWKVEVKTQDSLRNCASNRQGWLKVYDGGCLAGTRAGESFGKARTELSGIEKSTETKVIAITDNDIPVFQDTSSYDPYNEVCSLPEGTIIKIHNHRCDGDNLWLNFQVEYIGDVGSVNKACEEGIMYWLPYGGVVGCSSRSLDEILENNEYLTVSGQESSEIQSLGERISFQGDSPNFVYSLICKFAFKLISERGDDYDYFSSYDINNWNCESARGCKPAPWCGDGFFICPKNPIAGYISEVRDYGQDKMGTLIDACKSVNPYYVILCEDTSVACTDDYTCNAVFEGSDNTCYGEYCDYQKADFFFLCSDVS